MSFINGILGPLVNGFLFPFRDMPPIIGLSVVSLLTAIFLLIVFKHTSNQKALADVKRRIHAGLFEIRLYNDDFRSIMKAQSGILRANLAYMRYSIAPMIWTLPPLILLIAQLQFHYGYSGLEPGQQVLLKVEVADATSIGNAKPDYAVAVPEGLELDTPGVWVPILGEMAWRLSASAPGDYELEIRNGAETATKTVSVTDRVVRRSPFKIRGFVNQLLYPAEPALPETGAIEAITVTYPEANIDVFGFEIHWMILFFVLSIAFAFALRGPFGVTL
jgi:uncharacterized membrane protein (DUF106 family)